MKSKPGTVPDQRRTTPCCAASGTRLCPAYKRDGGDKPSHDNGESQTSGIRVDLVFHRRFRPLSDVCGYAKVICHDALDAERPCMPILTANLLLTTTPLWAAAVVLLVPTTIFAMCGPVIVRRYVSLNHLRTNNEVAGFKFAAVGVIYAVLLASNNPLSPCGPRRHVLRRALASGGRRLPPHSPRWRRRCRPD